MGKISIRSQFPTSLNTCKLYLYEFLSMGILFVLHRLSKILCYEKGENETLEGFDIAHVAAAYCNDSRAVSRTAAYYK